MLGVLLQCLVARWSPSWLLTWVFLWGLRLHLRPLGIRLLRVWAENFQGGKGNICEKRGSWLCWEVFLQVLPSISYRYFSFLRWWLISWKECCGIFCEALLGRRERFTGLGGRMYAILFPREGWTFSLWRFLIERCSINGCGDLVWKGMFRRVGLWHLSMGRCLLGWLVVAHRGLEAVGFGPIFARGKMAFTVFVRFKINNGERVRFWHDPWCER